MTTTINPTWYTDDEARIAHEAMKKQLGPFVAEMFPGYELSHTGFNRDFNTEEITIKLHLNQIGSVKVRADDQPDFPRLPHDKFY